MISLCVSRYVYWNYTCHINPITSLLQTKIRCSWLVKYNNFEQITSSLRYCEHISHQIMPKNKKLKHKGSKRKSKGSNGFGGTTTTTATLPINSNKHFPKLSSISVNAAHENSKKKSNKKKKNSDAVSQIASSFSKLDITSSHSKYSKKPGHISIRNFSHSAGITRSSGNGINNLEDVVRYIKNGRAKNIIVMCGAGISTPSGIPDFRTPGTGLYDNLQKYKIPTPTAIFDMDYFVMKPKPFFELAKELYPSGKYRPNLVHYFLRAIHEKGLLLRLYTQNIDGLERLAGIPPSKLVEAHGTFATASCTKCGKKCNGEAIKEKIYKSIIPRCEQTPLCYGIVKPDIVFFGEDLPKRFYYYLKDFPVCDLLVVMGTSLEVEPFASLVDSVRYNVPRLLINRDLVGPFKSRTRPTDAVATGDAVEVIERFSTLLGWKRFVNETMLNHEKLNKNENQSEVLTDSGVSSASSVSSEQKETRAKPIPPPNDNIKRYFHTLRSTPLPKIKSYVTVGASETGEPSAIPSSLSYFDYIRNTAKVKKIPESKQEDEADTGKTQQVLEKYTFNKGNAPTIQYARTIKKRTSHSKPVNRKVNCASVPAKALDYDSTDSQSDSTSTTSTTDS